MAELVVMCSPAHVRAIQRQLMRGVVCCCFCCLLLFLSLVLSLFRCLATVSDLVERAMLEEEALSAARQAEVRPWHTCITRTRMQRTTCHALLNFEYSAARRLRCPEQFEVLNFANL